MISILTNESTKTHGGIQRFIARLAKALVGIGETVVLIEPNSLIETPDVDGLLYRRFEGHSRVASMIHATVALFRTLLNERKSAVIAAIWFPSGFIVALLPRFLRGKFGIIAHGTEIAPKRGGVRRVLMQWTFRRADVIFANSTMTRGLLAQAGISRNVIVVGCGVEDRPLERATSEAPVLLSVGRLVARKGFDRMIEAMPRVLQSAPRAVYRLAGDGPLRSDLMTLAASLGIAESVQFLGAIGDSDLEAEYNRAWCFTMPCRRIDEDVEGFGIVYLEAAMAGLPSIGGRDSGAEDAIQDGVTGLLVDGTDVAAIADAATSLLTDREFCARLGSAARSRALSVFSWPDIAISIRSSIR